MFGRRIKHDRFNAGFEESNFDLFPAAGLPNLPHFVRSSKCLPSSDGEVLGGRFHPAFQVLEFIDLLDGAFSDSKKRIVLSSTSKVDVVSPF